MARVSASRSVPASFVNGALDGRTGLTSSLNALYTSAAVDQETEGDRRVVAGEEADRLRRLVLEGGERVPREVGDVSAFSGFDRRVQHDELRGCREDRILRRRGRQPCGPTTCRPVGGDHR